MTSHYFSDLQAPTPDQLHPISVTLAGRDCQLHSADGVFSTAGLDKATTILLEYLQAPAAGRLLDLGCGWGPLALTAALVNPHLEIWAVDVNTRALALTAKNAATLGLTNIKTLPAEQALMLAHQQNIEFTQIWSNPPVRIGKPALQQLLYTWFSLLRPTGQAVFIQSRHLGADSIAKWLTANQLPTNRIASKQGFRVLATTRQHKPA